MRRFILRRIERVLETVRELSVTHKCGVSAVEVAGYIKASRQNVSSDLNTLWRTGTLIKTGTKPILYWAKEAYTDKAGDENGTGLTRPGASGSTTALAAQPDDPFSQLIGGKDTLRNQVEQGKAAMLYPPIGLHTLLVGPTGVGKSLFAELMYRFGQASGRLSANARFVTLNCADYAHNPQLLLAQLFGSAQGSYTGADKDRTGLVEKANGGILFLDEVHRLPAEGQEILFRLLDKGLYQRLGEAGKERQISIMLIAATTEHIDSALLRTFTRRIPMLISLPPLRDWTLKERFRIIQRFLQQEAMKINVDIRLTPQALRALLAYECSGNIGQLRSDLQLACAKVFLRYLANRRQPAEIEREYLPDHIYRAMPGVRELRSSEIDELVRQHGQKLYCHQSPNNIRSLDEEEELHTFYDLLEQQMRSYQAQGIEPEAAEKLIASDIEAYFHGFLDQVRSRCGAQRQELVKLVEGSVLRAVEKAVVWIEDRLRRTVPERTLYAFALHINSSLDRLRQGQTCSNSRLFPPLQQTTLESQVAAEAICLLSKELGITLPQADIGFLSLLLRPEEVNTEPCIGIVVLAHGRGIASGMVEVAQTLTGMNLAIAIDMALDQEPAEVQEALLKHAASGRFDGGMLLLTDMGSLENMGQVIKEKTGIAVRTISFVSSPLVLEAVHQAAMPGCTLESVFRSVIEARDRLLGRENPSSCRRGVIVTCCFTGEGSALTLAKVVREAIGEHAAQVEIIPASIGIGSQFDRLTAASLTNKRLLAVVGPIDPRLTGIPYISTDEMVIGTGGKRLLEILGGGDVSLPAPAAGAINVEELMTASLSHHLSFINPYAAVPIIADALSVYSREKGCALDDELRVGLIMHIACLANRVAQQQLSQAPQELTPQLSAVPCLLQLNQQFGLNFTVEDIERLQTLFAKYTP